MLGALSWFLLVLGASADAAELRLEVGGVGKARSVIAMGVGPTRAPADVLTAPCADDGTAGDTAVDGVWTCGPLDLPAGEATLALSVDGRLEEVGAVVVSGGGTALQVQRERSGFIVGTSGDLLVPVEGSSAQGRTPLVVARVSGDFSGGAPVMRIVGPQGTVQAPCRDDGTFPDATRNDGVLACAGPATGAEVGLWLQGAGGEPKDLGRYAVPADALLAVFDLDADALTGTVVADTPWPWPPPPKEEATPPEPGPDPVPPEPGPDPMPPDGGPDPVAPQPIIDRAAPQAHAGAASSVGRGTIDLLAILGALAVGFGLAWVIRPRGPRLPPGVEPLPTAPLFDPGPDLSERAAVFATASPEPFLAELLRRLSRRRPVLLVLAEDAVPAGLSAIDGEPLYRTTTRDFDEVDHQVRALQKTSGRTPAVVVLGRDTLTAPGAVADDPAARLVDVLPQGAWVGFVVADDADDVGFLRPWRARRLDGGTWALEREA